jgi:hypothetical protein
MSFIPRLIRFKTLLAEREIPGYGRTFKVIHPNEQYSDGGLTLRIAYRNWIVLRLLNCGRSR